LKKYDQAIFDQAITLNPQDANSFYNRGIAYGALGKYDQVIADFESFIRLAGSEYQSYVPGVKQVIEELRLKLKTLRPTFTLPHPSGSQRTTIVHDAFSFHSIDRVWN